jgi:hypothetical protein
LIDAIIDSAKARGMNLDQAQGRASALFSDVWEELDRKLLRCLPPK